MFFDGLAMFDNVKEFKEIGELMAEVLDSLVNDPHGNEGIERSVRDRVKALTERFPIY